jgi:hypothetical protein
VRSRKREGDKFKDNFCAIQEDLDLTNVKKRIYNLIKENRLEKEVELKS